MESNFFFLMLLFLKLIRQEQGVYGSFASVEEFNLGLIPFDSDLLSMEMEEAYRVK